MQLNCEKTCDQSQSSIHQRVQDLKKNISFTNTQLHKLVSNEQKFSERIKELNRKAIKQIHNQSFDEAIVYLGEAEKNLEYAASCGMAIDRILIITTLKNLACGYQRLWQLTTCYDYIEALIFNLSIQNDDHEKLLKSEAIKDKTSGDYEKLSKITSIKLKLAISYLQFSALSSQLGRHEEANKNAHKSLTQFKIITEICHSYELITKGKTSILLDNIRSSIEFKGTQNISKKLVQAKIGLQKIKDHVYFFNFDSNVIEKVSMGDIMQVRCTTVEEATELESVTWFTSQLGLTYMVIYISCCFFALATEIRLAIPEHERLQSDYNLQLESAKLHHLHSIVLASQFVLMESNYLNHIIKSFKNNFHIDLLEEHFPMHNSGEISSHLLINQFEQSALKHQTATMKSNFHDNKNDEGIQVNIGQSVKNQNKNKYPKYPNESSNTILTIKKISPRKNSFIQKFKSSKSKLTKTYISQTCINKNEKKKISQIISTENSRIRNIKKFKKDEQGSLSKDKKIQNQYFPNKIQVTYHQKRILSPSASSRGRGKVVRKTEQSNSSRCEKLKPKIKTIKSPKRQ